MTPHDTRWSQMSPDEPGWSQMIRDDPRWFHMIPHPRCLLPNNQKACLCPHARDIPMYWVVLLCIPSYAFALGRIRSVAMLFVCCWFRVQLTIALADPEGRAAKQDPQTKFYASSLSYSSASYESLRFLGNPGSSQFCCQGFNKFRHHQKISNNILARL